MDKKILDKYTPMTETAAYILLAIAQLPKHGYSIVQYVKTITSNEICLGNGTLYGSLKKMENDGLIKVEFCDDKKKTYGITELGSVILSQEGCRIQKLSQLFEKELNSQHSKIKERKTKPFVEQ